MLFSDLNDVYRYLDCLPSFQLHGAKAARLGLDRIRSFCDKLGNPERHVPCIHVAGTNGKGSVSAMLALVYEKAGYRCGLYTSPHLEYVSERIRINRKVIPESEMFRFFELHGAALVSAELSYFEITTAMAFWWFSRQKVDLAIIETGLGGRLDATNIVIPQVSVITSISHDHQNVLGNTIRQIALEKGGIIKQGQPVVVGHMPPEARKVIAGMAAECNAGVEDVRRLRPQLRQKRKNDGMGSTYRFLENGTWITVETDLPAPVHRWNIAAARLVTLCMKSRFYVSLSIFCETLRNVGESGLLRGRFERLANQYPWYFDGAHNPEAVKALIDTIRRQSWDSPPVMILCLMEDKVQKKMLEPFSVFEKNYYYVSGTERAADLALITPYLSNIKKLPRSEEEIIKFFSGLTKEVVIFTGSYYFYGVVKRWISCIIKAEQLHPVSDH